MSSKTRLGFIGLSGDDSWAMRAHVPFFRSDKNNNYTIAAIQNSSKESAERAAKKYDIGNVATYGDPKSLAQDPNVDMVAVSVSVPGHYDAIKPALEAGKDIFVEWPLARTLADAEELTALAQKKRLRTLVGLQARQNPSILALKKLVDEGSFGEVYHMSMHAYAGMFVEHIPEKLEYLTNIKNGANLLTIPFGHTIDALCYVFGEWKYVSATLGNRKPKISVVDETGKVVREIEKTSHDIVAVSGTLQQSGAVVNMVYDGGANPTDGPGFVWEIRGSKGTALLEGPQAHVQMFQPKIKFAKAGEKLKEVDVKWIGNDFSHNVGQAWNAFAGAGDGHVTTFEDALLRHKMVDAIYRSNESGKREHYL